MQDDFKMPSGQADDSVAAKNQSDGGPAHEAPRHSAVSKPPKRRRSFSLKHLSKKQRLAIIAITALVLVGGTVAALQIFKKDPAQPPAPAAIVPPPPPEPPKPTTEASRLTGLQIDPDLNKLPVTGVMIENSPDARPQSGLTEAGIVFEAVAEGGITRFLALYLESKPDYIGPVRSVRPYYLDLLQPFDAAIAHAGGSAKALAQIRKQGVKDLDQFANPGAYRRVSSRFAPHNLYTSRDKLLDVQKKKGFKTSDFDSWVRKEKEEPVEEPTAKKIDFSLSGFLYNPTFNYDAKTNTYKRKMAGRNHVDEKSGDVIAPKVVIAVFTDRRQDGIYSVYRVDGKGTVYVFQDGEVIKGTWRKNSRKSQFTFTGKNGEPIALNPGQTWVTLVTSGSVKYK